MKNEGTVKEADSATAKPVLALRQSDNVGVVRQPLNAGDVIEVGGSQIGGFGWLLGEHALFLAVNHA